MAVFGIGTRSRCRKRQTPHKCYIFRAAWQNSWHKKKTPTANAMRVFLCLVVLFADHMDTRARGELAPVLVIPLAMFIDVAPSA